MKYTRLKQGGVVKYTSSIAHIGRSRKVHISAAGIMKSRKYTRFIADTRRSRHYTHQYFIELEDPLIEVVARGVMGWSSSLPTNSFLLPGSPLQLCVLYCEGSGNCPRKDPNGKSKFF